jgi:uncharacterized protein involved in exopolysaccharide biosynthesis
MEEQLRPDEGLRFNQRSVTAENGHTGTGQTRDGRASTFALRDLLAIGFRHRRLVLLSFVLIFSMASVLVLLWPAKYEAQMKILVKRERVDPPVTSEETSQQPLLFSISEEEMNSEVELLKSRDLLAQVAVATGLHKGDGSALRTRLKKLGWGQETEEQDRKIASAVQQLERKLDVQPLRKSNVIQVSYPSRDPALSAAVLTTLADRYRDKHLAVHRPSGAVDFFEHETERYGSQLTLMQARLTEQNRNEGVVSVQVEKENALRRLGELEEAEQTTEAEIAETAARIKVLESQIASTPVRTTTEIRDRSAVLLEQLHSTLVTYELKRIDLLRAFQPGYPLVQDVEAQIATVRAAIAAARESPLAEEATDRNPTFDFLLAELAKNRSELAGQQARATATAQGLSLHRERARRLEQVELAQQTLVRAAAQAEQNYVISSRKREEARISNALDVQRILNVAIAEEATVPFEPSGPPKPLLLLLGALFAGVGSVMLAFVVDYLDPSFRTPDEVQAFLGSPVLAAIPRNVA